MASFQHVGIVIAPITQLTIRLNSHYPRKLLGFHLLTWHYYVHISLCSNLAQAVQCFNATCCYLHMHMRMVWCSNASAMMQNFSQLSSLLNTSKLPKFKKNVGDGGIWIFLTVSIWQYWTATCKSALIPSESILSSKFITMASWKNLSLVFFFLFQQNIYWTFTCKDHITDARIQIASVVYSTHSLLESTTVNWDAHWTPERFTGILILQCIGTLCRGFANTLVLS